MLLYYMLDIMTRLFKSCRKQKLNYHKNILVKLQFFPTLIICDHLCHCKLFVRSVIIMIKSIKFIDYWMPLKWLNSCKGTRMIHGCREGMAFKYWKNCLKHCWIFRGPELSCGLVDMKFSPFSLSSIPVLISVSTVTADVSRTQRITFAQRLPMASRPRSFDENSRKAVKEEKIKSVALSALVSADPPWESLWDHNTSHKTVGARPAVWKGPASRWSEGGLNWRRERVEGKERFLVYTGWMRVLVVKPIELEQERWSGSWYVGVEEEGGLVGHYMKPKYNTSPSFSHSCRSTSLLCLPQVPYGFS